LNAPFGTKRIEFFLPPLHADQWKCDRTKGRFLAVRCGRRWGKSHYGIVRAISCALGHGIPGARPGRVGWFAPEFRKLQEAYGELVQMAELIKNPAGGSRKDDRFTFLNGGRIDFWSLEDEHAGRSRRYDLVVGDEVAFSKDSTMMNTWEKAIKPTLFDTGGKALMLSNTNGVNPANFFWRICNEKKPDGTNAHGFAEYHAPTRNNPILPLRDPMETDMQWLERRAKELQKLIDDNPPLVYQQEYEAGWVDWSGDAFFARDKLLINGLPVQPPVVVESVFAVIDTAVKDGKEHDSTACVIFALLPEGHGHRLLILDWHVLQIEGASLEQWLPGILAQLNDLAAKHCARFGSIGAFIEDKSSGSVLIQQARNRGLKAKEIPKELTAVGKDGRAIMISGYVYRGLVKISPGAYDKVVSLKGVHANHLLTQIVNYRVGDKNAGKRADDLYDAWSYGVALALEERKIGS
jgi:phage terminase large subunit-like protein